MSRVYHTINRKTIPDAKKAGYHRHDDTLPLFFTNGSDLHCSCPVPPNRGGANGAPAGGAFLVDIPTEAVAEVRGPDELRLLIFPQPLDGALKNQNAAPASPPCFRRRQTGCGTQHPLRLACVSLAAAPTTPRCFRRWRRSSSLQSAPLLFSSTRLCESDICAKENRQCISTPAVFSWARVDYASRAAKNSLAGCFCPAGREAPGRSCSNPP